MDSRTGAPTAESVSKNTPWPPAHVAWSAMGVFALVRLSAQLDLGILSLLVQPIKTDLGLSDSQIGLLLGFAFALFYVLLGVPFAALVDRYSRKLILTAGIVVWSLMTAATGFANNFVQLFLCRVGVGIGESVNGPATYSMISDYFPRERLPRAIAVLTLGSVAGTGLSLVIGAFVIGALAHMPQFVLPFIGPIKHWQLVFFIVGLPGLLIAALMLCVPEPVRRGHVKPAAGAARPNVIQHLIKHWPIFLPMFLGVALSGIESGGTQMWRPAFFQRTYGWSPQQAGMATGITQLIAAPIGLFLGAWLSERFAKRKDDANLRVVAIAWITATPMMILGPLMPTPELAVLLSALATMCSMMGGPTQNAALQSVAPNHMRAQITALYLLTYVLAGNGIGPSFIAAITEFVIKDEASLHYALSGSAAFMMPLAIIVIVLGMRPYGREIARLKSLDSAPTA